MRLRDRSGGLVHLAYSTSVHPAGDTEGVIAHLTRYGERVRRRLGVDRLGLALELNPETAAALVADRGELVRLRRALADRGLETVMLDGVFDAPDWAQPEQYRYTLDLARILAHLLPSDVPEGSVTTMPLSRRRDWPAQLTGLALRRLERLARELRGLAMTSGRKIHVGMVPRPGCLIAGPEEAAAYLDGLAPDHLGASLDVRDHQAAPGLPVTALRLSDSPSHSPHPPPSTDLPDSPGLLPEALARTGVHRVAVEVPPAERSIPQLVDAIASRLNGAADPLRPAEVA